MSLPQNPESPTENGALIDAMMRLAEPLTVELERGSADASSVLVVPKGFEVHQIKKYLDAYLPTPERRTGTTMLTDTKSFVAWVNRSKNPNSSIYADDVSKTPNFTAIIDHDERGPDSVETARWGQHRAFLPVEISDAWAAWMKAHNTGIAQREFAELIEDRALDLLDEEEAGAHQTVELAVRLGLKLSTPAEVIAASRGLRIRAEVNVGEATLLSSGEVELQYTETHKGVDGGPLRVPSAFLIGVPVLKGQPRDVLLARLRYRRVPGQPRVVWCVVLHQPDEVQRLAFDELIATVASETGLDVFRGTAPAPRQS